jgi:hypothetical protein
MRGRRRGRSTGLWGALAACLTIVALIVQTVLMVVLALAAWGLTALTAWIEFRSDLARVHAAPPAPPKRSSGPTKGSSGGRAPDRVKGSTGGGGGGAKAGRPRRCSVACRRSTKPAKDCQCSCKGTTHGSERPGV